MKVTSVAASIGAAEPRPKLAEMTRGAELSGADPIAVQGVTRCVRNVAAGAVLVSATTTMVIAAERGASLPNILFMTLI
jgi:hypothetical protein